ncbi:hypothetical protein ELUMI_v1c05300 [Williamsoniiplasma luminosum]|uniref:Uncharacterized protein n=1 Tax=Williamsoniiplasma luminosum TaxID=214888 RepID=A0A2K8NU10_9MOLU|nr:hypothetical protein [Williamsoniiplasma luminosum]ATZ17254.1 hypothetical protein ELUMI_v1c05300 [Williamsoniiplasma luminosum]
MEREKIVYEEIDLVVCGECNLIIEPDYGISLDESCYCNCDDEEDELEEDELEN